MVESKDLTVLLCLTDEDDKLYSKEIMYEYAKFPVVISKVKGLGNARRDCIDRVTTPYCLIIDADTVLDMEYIEEAVLILKHGKEDVVVVAVDYEYPHTQGHLAMGTSIWKTEVLKKLYDYQNYKGELCECVYMWRRVLQNNYKIETLPFYAVHLKKVN